MSYSRFRPDLSPEGRKRLAQLRAEFTPRFEAAAVLREIRQALDLRQADVAAALDTTQSNVSKIEAKGDPTLTTLAKIARAHGRVLRITLRSKAGDNDDIDFEVA